MTGRKQTEKLIHLDMEQLATDVPSTKDVIRKKLAETESPQQTQKTVGELLKEARKAKNKALEDVSKKICVKPVYLEALETGKYYAFPNMTYGIGFLRLYAGYLGLEAKELVDKFKVEANLVSPPTQSLTVDTTGRLPSKKVALITIGAGIAFLLVVGVMTTLKNRTVSEAPVATEEKVVEQLTEGQTLQVKEPLVYGLKEPAHLSLTATEEVWIEVADSKGTVLLNQILYTGDRYNPPDDTKYSLSTGNAGALQLSIDGEVAGPLGPVGEQKKGILLDSELLKKEATPETKK